VSAVAGHPAVDGRHMVHRVEGHNLVEDRLDLGRHLPNLGEGDRGHPWGEREVKGQAEAVGDAVDRVRGPRHVGHLVPDLIFGEPLQLPGCAMGDESVLADIDGADHRRDQLFLRPRQGAIHHRASRGPSVRTAELRDGEEDPAHLRDEVDLEPRLRRFAEPLILGGELIRLGDVNDLHDLLPRLVVGFRTASVRGHSAQTHGKYALLDHRVRSAQH